ncbi:unnamed protein product [Sphagnum balticum]
MRRPEALHLHNTTTRQQTKPTREGRRAEWRGGEAKHRNRTAPHSTAQHPRRQGRGGGGGGGRRPGVTALGRFWVEAPGVPVHQSGVPVRIAFTARSGLVPVQE